MTAFTYMNILYRAEAISAIFPHDHLKSELVDVLIENYEMIYKATNDDEGDEIYNRILDLMEV